jgi:hypothetical protein
MAVRLTQSLIEMSGTFSLGVKTAGAYGWQPYHLHVPIVLKSGSLNFLEPSGPVQACNGIASLYGITRVCWMQQNEFIAVFQTSQGQWEKKAEFILEQAMKAQCGSRAIVYSFFNLSARLGWIVNTMSWSLYPLARDPVPTTQEGGRSKAQSGQLQKISRPPGFDPLTVQPIASCYTTTLSQPMHSEH